MALIGVNVLNGHVARYHLELKNMVVAKLNGDVYNRMEAVGLLATSEVTA